MEYPEINIRDFFEDLGEFSILFDKFIWSPLKLLKEYLYDTISLTLPKIIPINEPLKIGYFLTTEGEVIPLTQVKIREQGIVDFYGEILEGAIISPGVIFGGRKILLKKGVYIETGVFIGEPAIIGEFTEIRHCAYVRGSVWTGKKVVIGHTTEVKNSLFFPHAKAPHFAYVGDSILGKEVNLGAGTKLANLKFTKKEIKIRINNKVYNTGLRKFGAIIGDYSQTGCNVVLLPGTLLGKNSYVFPGVVPPSGIYPPHSKIKG